MLSDIVESIANFSFVLLQNIHKFDYQTFEKKERTKKRKKRKEENKIEKDY